MKKIVPTYRNKGRKMNKLYPVYQKILQCSYESNDDVLELYRALDFGLNFGVGYQVNNFLFNANYSAGLLNMTPNYDADEFNIDEDFTEGFIQKNRVFTFSVSYFFN